MVTCRRCGKQGWRYEMEIAFGMWYCQPCYSTVEKTLVPSTTRAEQDLEQFLQRRRAHFEFVRYLVKIGTLGEWVITDHGSSRRREEEERSVGA